MQRALGWDRELSADSNEQDRLRSYIAFQMASAGLAPPSEGHSDEMAAFSAGILESLREKIIFLLSTVLQLMSVLSII